MLYDILGPDFAYWRFREIGFSPKYGSEFISEHTVTELQEFFASEHHVHIGITPVNNKENEVTWLWECKVLQDGFLMRADGVKKVPLASTINDAWKEAIISALEYVEKISNII